MKCQICKKNEANIIFTQIVDDEKIVLQICSKCAAEKGISIAIEKPTAPKVNSLLGSVTCVFGEKVSETDTGKKEEAVDPDLACAECGLTFVEFKKTGLFGCDKCHRVFGKYIRNLLKQIHGTDVYEGKSPKTISPEGEKIQQLKVLRAELKRRIDGEEYERAAELRDRIADLEGKKSPQ